ncbi:AAA family ATPase [Elizabethkingia anophelis]|uniref:AAA family ATPase n=1 Tax=Elizabethkingia anophelis TaxID=1117645 RepID=UPI00136F4646|nr:AAA family ATPase [Elizabethkingia anophelis]MCT3832268.1 AAA family ATPase [Elizabethkingia anophelis]MCT3975789.1 AAA family ATPase [Elizabethkingia anophelis]MCT4039218.1 AAA family ATPase [Elizabethkingia anophelis]MYY30246.1 ATP-binding cassette domain-containing protein [Elizabethkingia anophelis]HAY3508356.1 AAA family ATPase [Elizabethkingia anophelis]
MKITHLEIKGYKNITRKIVFDFTNAENYVALIGLNGSGKSNVLEAISLIFASLYQNKSIKEFHPDYDFQYNIIYTIDNKEIQIENGIYTLVSQDGVVKNKEIKRSKIDYLPSEVFACYSGDEQRMWDEIYSKFYFTYFNKLARGSFREKQKLVYVNKYSWQIALLTLICQDDSSDYIKEILKVNDLTDISIFFDFPNNYDRRLEWYVKNIDDGEEAYNEALTLIRTIKTRQEEKGNPLHLNEIRDIVVLQTGNNEKNCRKLFFLLFAVGMNKDKKLFTKIEIKNNQLGLKQLSEGEKRLILIKCILNVLANKNSIILLDEPDSHLHIVKKKQLKTYLQESEYCSVLTSHSPSLLNSFPDESTFILNDKGSGINVTNASKFSDIKNISGNEFSLMDGVVAVSSKNDIILVEGKYDEKYLTRALRYFKTVDAKYKILNFDFINGGGADNTIQIYNKIYRSINSNQNLFIICDDDDPGRKTVAEVNKKITKTGKRNLHAFVYPKTSTKKFPKDFLLEDYFSLETYKKYYSNKVSKAKQFKDLKGFQDPKSYIENNFDKFKLEDFKGFKKIIDKLYSIKVQ